MAQTASDNRPCQIDILVTDGFVLIELAAIVDTIRIANRVSPRPVFTWTYRSVKGGIVESRCEVLLRSEAFTPMPDAEYVFVIGNSDPDNPALSVGRQITSYTHRGAKVFLLAEAASRYIRERKDNGNLLATHWENSEFLRERSGVFEAETAIATEDGPVVTCAGMGSTLDLVLAMMRPHLSTANLMTVANVMLHEKIRDYSTRQPLGSARSTGSSDRELDRCLEIMQENIEDPVPISELAETVGVSSRSLERKFRAHLGTTPKNYYRELRLTRANNLLLNTDMSVREVGLACGYTSGFSSVYRNAFGIAPNALRKKRRVETTRSEGQKPDRD